jgi:D,D-heptose 1,7-bisphosphate phosphatase
MKRKAIFLDKDGTLIPDIPFNVDPKRITFNKGTAEGLKLLAAGGFHLVIITNQSGVARGYFSVEDLDPVYKKIKELCLEENIHLDGFYFCPHHPQGTVKEYAEICDCRKPLPGMIIKAARELNIDISESWMIGDILNDVEAGNRAGCRTILIDNGNETEWTLTEVRTPLFRATDLHDAARYILKQSNCEEHEKRLVTV